MRARALLPLLLASALTACQQDTAAPSANLYALRVEEVWQRFDGMYPMFRYKGVDWDAQHEQARAAAARLSSQAELATVLTNMLAPLRDGHVYLVRPDGSRLATTSLADRLPNWDQPTWSRYVTTVGFHQVGRTWGWARFGDVGYVIVSAMDVADVRAAAFDSVMEQLRGTRALILDVRMNGGGNSAVGDSIAGRFADSTRYFGAQRWRNGRGRDQLMDYPATVRPRAPWRYAQPVFVLAGRRAFSATETFVLEMEVLPQVTVMGDTTGGSTGNPAVFDLGEGWSYSVSRSPWVMPDGRIVEGAGVPPDVVVAATAADFARGVDPVLDSALARARR